MRYTIWSNGGKFEWVVFENEEIVKRSGLIYLTRREAKKALENAF